MFKKLWSEDRDFDAPESKLDLLFMNWFSGGINADVAIGGSGSRILEINVWQLGQLLFIRRPRIETNNFVILRK